MTISRNYGMPSKRSSVRHGAAKLNNEQKRGGLYFSHK